MACGWIRFLVYLPFFISGSKAVDILQAYEGTLEDDYPPDNERCEHGEMLLYKVAGSFDSSYTTGGIIIYL